MKLKNYLSILLAGLLLAACNKNELTTPEFNVSVDRNTFKVTEDVVFRISGTPDNISFFSGESGRVYDSRNDLTGAGAVNRLSFTTQIANLPTGNTGQANNLRVFASTDFSGRVDSAGIRRATWTDITSRAKLATSSTATASDTLNVTDLSTSRDTMFIAFRYLSTTSSNASRARSWTMARFIFQNRFPNGSIFTHNTVDTDNRLAGFNSYSYRGTSAKDSLVWNNAATAIFPAGVDNLSDEDWLISKPFKLSARNPDKGVGIKKNTLVLDSYTYRFSRPGQYVVTFVANNASAEGVKEVVKQLNLTITN